MTGHIHDADQHIAGHNVVIVGYGQAGSIHGRAYQRLQDNCRVTAVVEPNPDRHELIKATLPGVTTYRELEPALREQEGDVVVDFCVPAKKNLELVETALGFGIRKFLIEKPLGWDVASTHAVVERLKDCDVIYLDSYLASTGVKNLIRAIREQGSDPQQVEIIFHKNRISDSLLSRGFTHDAVPSAWMIEGPHMLSIARQIAGEIAEITRVDTFDMTTECGEVFRDHGGGVALLQHENGTQTRLDLSLCSERNERRVVVSLGNDVRMAVDLPPSKTKEQHSVMQIDHPSGERSVKRFEDRPVENCVRSAIRHLNGEDIGVASLTDGLAVCSIVERMTKRKTFWQSVPSQWKHFGPPLRPSSEDIEIMQDQVSRWVERTGEERCRALLCGVTQEIVRMDWPAGSTLWAVEKSKSMIEEVWTGRDSRTKLAMQAEWTKLPFAPNSLDIVIGDGCFTSLRFPERQLVFLNSIRRVLRDNGVLIMRFFVQEGTPESPEAVFQQLREGRIGSFHAFKWRLAMALQNTASEGVRVDKVWEVWKEANITTDWPPEEVKTIDTYRGSDHCLTFTNLSEIRGLMSTSFEELAYIEPGYELGERCPVLVYAPRTAAGRQAG